MDFHKIAIELVDKLNEHELGAYVWHKATTGSAYIRFADSRMGSVRISNHSGSKKYKYKFNLLSDFNSYSQHKDNNVWQYFYPMKQMDKMISDIVKRKEFFSTWTAEKKYDYKIPAFKKKQEENRLANIPIEPIKTHTHENNSIQVQPDSSTHRDNWRTKAKNAWRRYFK